jgi:hypothetical protein
VSGKESSTYNISLERGESPFFRIGYLRKFFLTHAAFFCIINLMKKYSRKPWSTKERNLLRDYYYLVDSSELEKIFPDRSYNAIVKQVAYLKARGWWFKTPEQE